MSDQPTQPTPRDDAPRQVLDPAWEDELRAGLEQDGGAGSVDDELAALHFLRHLREPQELAQADLDGIWMAMEPELRPKRWWQRAWFFVGAPALAGGAALLMVLVTPPEAGVESPRIAAETISSPHNQDQDQDQDQDQGSAAGSSSALGTKTALPSPAPAGPASSPLASASAPSGSSASALVLEQHFSVLEPGARRKLAGRVDLGRATARGDLLARARGTRS